MTTDPACDSIQGSLLRQSPMPTRRRGRNIRTPCSTAIAVDRAAQAHRSWEPGCGSGQATRGPGDALRPRACHRAERDSRLAQHWAQRSRAMSPSRSSPAKRTALADASVRLRRASRRRCTGSTAQRFFAECERVLTPGGVLAAWGYAGLRRARGHGRRRGGLPRATSSRTGRPSARWSMRATPASPGRSRRCRRPTLWLEAEWTLPHFLRLPRQHVGGRALPRRHRRGPGRARTPGAGGGLGRAGRRAPDPVAAVPAPAPQACAAFGRGTQPWRRRRLANAATEPREHCVRRVARGRPDADARMPAPVRRQSQHDVFRAGRNSPPAVGAGTVARQPARARERLRQFACAAGGSADPVRCRSRRSQSG